MVLVDEEYFNGWMAALDEMRHPGWREEYAQTARDIAARRGRDLDVAVKELGLEPHSTRRTRARRPGRPRRRKSR